MLEIVAILLHTPYMNNTQISWTDLSWNPASGCQPVSEGCRYCYAKLLAERKRGTRAFPNGFNLTIRPHKLNEPFKIKKPSRVFVNSMSDLFWDEIPTEYIDKVVDVIEQTPQHHYQILTKRVERMVEYSKKRILPDNFWAGVTVEREDMAYRIDMLRQVSVKTRFVSAEPLLGPISHINLDGISWVIVGGESGSHLHNHEAQISHGLVHKTENVWEIQSDKLEWVRDIRDACLNAGIAFFFKQWGGLIPTSNGKLLDGKEYHEIPMKRHGE